MTKAQAQELAQAKEALNQAIQTERDIMTAQSYEHNDSGSSTKVTKASLNQVAERIRYWKREIARLEGRYAYRGRKS
ncbi:DUF6148 family protein [Spirochaeta cellobiosiphila]|uniref:DUF6148 family protein n=1 Tax=Spirochaeta cellobiosiphila TaxID=504483 RepID=UPI0004173F9B|nr:DUF6148 family protein [Spirochaeta cellobiosiphila]